MKIFSVIRGAVSKLITDNGTPYVQALDILATQYGICHIQISPYNSQVNGVVEWHHYNVWEAIIKSTLGIRRGGIRRGKNKEGMRRKGDEEGGDEKGG